MRVLHVYRTYFPETQGGVEEVIRQICLSTRPHGVESRVLCVSPSIRPRVARRDEASVYRARLHLEVASCSMSAEALPMFRRLLPWADVVHYHYPWPFADALHFAARVAAPTVVTYHSDIVRQRLLKFLYAPLMNRFLRSVGRIVCTSPNYFATSPVLSRFERKVDVVPIGIDPAAYPAASDVDVRAARDRFGSGFFLFVGVLRYYKGLHTLLDAAAGQPFRIVIVGSGPTEAELKAQAERLQLDNVVLAGRVSEPVKMALLALCRGVVFPSHMRSEAFGVALLEGAMSGKPLISTEVGSGTSHVNVDGETGLVVAPGSHQALCQALTRLHHRPQLAERMGRRARERFDRLFNAALMGQRYVDVYRAVRGEGAARPAAGQADQVRPAGAEQPS